MKDFDDIKSFLQSDEIIAEAYLASTPAALVYRLEKAKTTAVLNHWVSGNPSDNIEQLVDFANDLVIDMCCRGGITDRSYHSLVSILIYLSKTAKGEGVLHTCQKLFLRNTEFYWISKIAATLLGQGASNSPLNIQLSPSNSRINKIIKCNTDSWTTLSRGPLANT